MAEKHLRAAGDTAARAIAKGYTRTWVKGKAVWIKPETEPDQQDARKHKPQNVSDPAYHCMARLWVILGHRGKLGPKWTKRAIFKMPTFLNVLFGDDALLEETVALLRSEAYDFTDLPLPTRQVTRAHGQWLAHEAGRRPDPLADLLAGAQEEPGEVPPPPGAGD